MDIAKAGINNHFNWGVATSAYQTEGAFNTDGKGKSIWDVFSHTNGKTFANQHADVSCDFYHHYAQDIALVSILNIPNFRFSLSWSRLLPHGNGIPNYKGIGFYNKVIDFCLDLGVEPWITLYHWDLPYELEKKGGWTNRQIVQWFSDYVQLCVRVFGDRVKHWMILNEPMVFTGAGYFLGVHAPGKKGLNNFLSAAHHAALCQAEGGRIVRSLQTNCKVGTTFSCSLIQANTPTEEDHNAAVRIDALVNRLFVEPLAGSGYPVKCFKLLQRMEQFVKDGDESKLSFDMDFIGVQNYTRELIAHSHYKPFVWAKVIHANKRNVETTAMNWEVYPECIYEMLLKFSAYNFKEIVVTENGAAFNDVVVNGEVYDVKRQIFLKRHIEQVLKAREEGVNVTGYFVWCLTDNFEWAEGYRPRFGLVHIDFTTQKRIIKFSGHWYGELMRNSSINTGIGKVISGG